MLITKECDYAVRILRALSHHQIASAADISREEHIPVQFAYKICRKLAKAGIIVSHRGTDGGYQMHMDIGELSLYDICKAVDKDLMISECMQPEALCSRNTCDRPCKVHKEFCRLQKVVIEEMSATKLSQLLV